MRWVPPRSLAAREAWAKEHPWLAGFYFGFFLSAALSLFFAFLGERRPSFALAFVLGIGTWILAWALFSVGLKSGFSQRLERPSAKDHPLPTQRRPWTRASDRFLFWFMLLGIAGAVVSAADLIGRSHARWGNVVSLLAGLWFAGTTWAEKKRRRDDTPQGSDSRK